MFLNVYAFDLRRAEWKHLDFQDADIRFSFDNDFIPSSINPEERESLRRAYLEEARSLASEMERLDPLFAIEDSRDIEDLKYFYYYHSA